MRTRVTAFAAALFVAAALHTVTAQTGSAGYTTPAAAVKFTPLDPKAPNGARISIVSGRMEGPGPVTFFALLPKGRPAGMHKHTASYHAVVIRGEMRHWLPGEEAKAPVLGPGSHWYQPGNGVHNTECVSTECLFFARYEGAVDDIPVPAK